MDVSHSRKNSGSKNFPKFKKSPSGLPKHMQEAKQESRPQRHKFNSTSSLYIKDTIVSPDVSQILHCMAIALYYHILNGQKTGQKNNDHEIFDEDKHPLSKTPVNTTKIPEVEQIYEYISLIFKAERLGAECAILCLAYIERIISLTGLTLTPANWRRVTLSALILASKVWEDQAVWNVDFLSVFPCVTVEDLGKLEKVILNFLGFNVSLKASLYAKYYFELRSLAENEHEFTLEPLSKEAAERLEQRSEEKEISVRSQQEKYKLSRSNSETNMKLKSPRVVIS
jgi:hypothetical protein